MRSFRAESRVEGELEGLLPDGIDEGVFVTLARVRPVEAPDGANRASLPAGDVVVEILALRRDAPGRNRAAAA